VILNWQRGHSLFWCCVVVVFLSIFTHFMLVMVLGDVVKSVKCIGLLDL